MWIQCGFYIKYFHSFYSSFKVFSQIQNIYIFFQPNLQQIRHEHKAHLRRGLEAQTLFPPGGILEAHTLQWQHVRCVATLLMK